MSYIFISYSKENQDYTHRLAEFLENAGFSIWIDHADIEYGVDWWDTIEQGIIDCAAMIVIMSLEAKSSKWVRKEALMGLNLKKPCFPILVSGECWNLFNDIQFIDVRNQKMPDEKFLKRLSEYMQSQQAIPIIPPQTTLHRSKVLDILPQPFEWITIPAGKVPLDIDPRQTFDVLAFQIAKYPITNAQYQVFVDAKDGYADEKWWDFLSEASMRRQQNTKSVNTGFVGNDFPRTNITWYDCIAFCRWLSAKTSENVILPTEAQWQRAAQGDDNHEYPWGKYFDKTLANTEESGIGKVTPVTQYPNGASPYGILDMSGNVWEWCLWDDTEITSAIESRPLRGGSWYVGSLSALTYKHNAYHPNSSSNNLGFRLALLS
jgi:hypothetical protein